MGDSLTVCSAVLLVLHSSAFPVYVLCCTGLLPCLRQEMAAFVSTQTSAHREPVSEKRKKTGGHLSHPDEDSPAIYDPVFAQGPTPLWGGVSGRQFVQAALDIFGLLLQPPVTWDWGLTGRPHLGQLRLHSLYESYSLSLFEPVC